MTASRRDATGAPVTAMDRALQVFPAPSADTQLNIGAVLHLDGTPPTLDRIREHLANRLPTLPALVSRLAPGSARWTAHPRLDLAGHVAECALPEGPQSLADAVGELARTPLLDDSPPWRLWLLHGHAAGRYALLYLVHHHLQDASGMLRTLELLFGPDVPARESSATYHGFTRPPRTSAAEQARQAWSAARGLRGTDPWRLTHKRPTHRRDFCWSRVPADVLGAVAQAFGGTRHDAYVAALAHSMAQWRGIAPSGRTVSDLPFLVPANVRRPDETALPGNRTTLVNVRLSGMDLDLDERMANTLRSTAPLKSPLVRQALRRNLDRMPTALILTTLDTLTTPRRAPALVSHVVLRHTLAFQDTPVTGVDPIMFAPKAVPLSVLLLTYGDTATACFRTDPGLPGLDHLHDDWERTLRKWHSATPRTAVEHG